MNLLLTLVIFITSLQDSVSFKVYKSHTNFYGTGGWCVSVVDPHWPFAYSKHVEVAGLEHKGRTASNNQSIGTFSLLSLSLLKYAYFKTHILNVQDMNVVPRVV